MSIAVRDITGVILAGGMGSRMGGVDKGLQDFLGQPLVAHALSRLRPQVGSVGINANRHMAQYEALGAPVWPDANRHFEGPLAGFAAAMAHCRTPYLLTVPCDTPRFPLDLAQRLGEALHAAQADIAMVTAPEPDANGQTVLRPQPVFCLLRTSLQPSLLAFMQSGGRKIEAWTAQHHTVRVPFNGQTDDAQSFFNINTLEQLQSFASQQP